LLYGAFRQTPDIMLADTSHVVAHVSQSLTETVEKVRVVDSRINERAKQMLSADDSDVVYQARRIGLPGKVLRTYRDIDSIRATVEDTTQREIIRRVQNRLKTIPDMVTGLEDGRLVLEVLKKKVDPGEPTERGILETISELEKRLGSR